VTRISLADYPLPIYDADQETRTGAPANALRLKQLMGVHHGVFITSPEYNASIAPLLKNALDWISRVHERGEPDVVGAGAQRARYHEDLGNKHWRLRYPAPSPSCPSPAGLSRGSIPSERRWICRGKPGNDANGRRQPDQPLR